MVRNTATGFEQGIAAAAGMFTETTGALENKGTIRGLQGKWTPWFILGLPAAPVLLIGQLAFLGAVLPDTKTTDMTRSEQAVLDNLCRLSYCSAYR